MKIDLKKILVILFCGLCVNANAQFSDLIFRDYPPYAEAVFEFLKIPNANTLSALQSSKIKKVLYINDSTGNLFFSIDVNSSGLPENYIELENGKDTVFRTSLVYDLYNRLIFYNAYSKQYGEEKYKFYYENDLLSSYKYKSGESSVDSVTIAYNNEKKIDYMTIYTIEGGKRIFNYYRGDSGEIDSIKQNDILNCICIHNGEFHFILNKTLRGTAFIISEGKVIKEILMDGIYAEKADLEKIMTLYGNSTGDKPTDEDLRRIRKSFKIKTYTIDYNKNGLPVSIKYFDPDEKIENYYYEYEYYQE